MSRTKTELEAENRQLRRVVGEVYDRIAEQLEIPAYEQEDDEDEEEGRRERRERVGGCESAPRNR